MTRQPFVITKLKINKKRYFRRFKKKYILSKVWNEKSEGRSGRGRPKETWQEINKKLRIAQISKEIVWRLIEIEIFL